MNNGSWAPAREDGYDEYDQYGDRPETKRDKRRRDMVDRVGRLLNDTVERRDRVFHDLSEIFARTADELLPPPVFPTYDLSIPVGQLPPSLPFTDPVIPDMHPTPFLFALHRLSLERAHSLLAVRLFHDHQLGVAKRLYDAEVEKIEEEYESATKGVVERLLEGVEERRKRLLDEKEGEGVNPDALLETQVRPHGTRRVRAPKIPGSTRPYTHSNAESGHDDPLLPYSQHPTNPPNPSSNPIPTTLESSTMLHLNELYDPFNLSATLIQHNPSGSLVSNLSAAAIVAPLHIGSFGRRKPGPRAQPGLPPAHFLVTSGAYNQFGKSLAGLAGLRGDEIDGDLGEVRRKRVRNAGAGAARRRMHGE